MQAIANYQHIPVCRHTRLPSTHDAAILKHRKTVAALFAAAQSGDIDTLMAALRTHAPLIASVRNEHNDTLLHVAARASHRHVVQHIVYTYGSDVLGARNHSGCTPLMEATRDISVTRELICAGADTNATDADGYSCLIYAVVLFAQRCGHLSSNEAMLRLLAANGADVDAQHSETGQSALHVAATLECMGAMAVLIDLGANVSTTDSEGNTIVDIAAARGSTNVLQWLDTHGLTQDFERAADTSTCTPLTRAAVAGHLDAVQFFVDWQDRRDKRDCVSMCLCQTESCTSARPFCSSTRTSCVSTFHRNEALYAALKMGNYDITAFLCSRGGRVSSIGAGVGCAHTTALHIAVKLGQLDLVEFLLERELADVNYRNQRGRTPLHTAAVEGDVSIVQLLLAHGADVDMVSTSRLACMAKQHADMMTPIEFAARHGHSDVVALLLQHGVSVLDDGLCDESLAEAWREQVESSTQ